MASVYIETTIPSFYFETRTSLRARAWREATIEWWSTQRRHFDLVTSRFALQELDRAPGGKALSGRKLLDGIPVLEETPDTDRVIAFYTTHRLMPSDALGDAAHLAIASLHSIDFLLTWNCRHLANANKVRAHPRAQQATPPAGAYSDDALQPPKGGALMPTRKTRKPLPEEPTVAEIRAIRAQLWKEAGGDIRKYVENAAKAGKRSRGSHPVRRQPRRGKAA